MSFGASRDGIGNVESYSAQIQTLEDRVVGAIAVIDYTNTSCYGDLSQVRARSSNAGRIIQHTGSTNANYTNGYFYKCVNDNGTYKWQRVDVQPSSGGGGGADVLTIEVTESNGVYTANKTPSEVATALNVGAIIRVKYLNGYWIYGGTDSAQAMTGETIRYCFYYSFPYKSTGDEDIEGVDFARIDLIKGSSDSQWLSVIESSEILNPISGGGTTVIANPTLVGTEANLTALQVGETKYKIPSGGGSGTASFIITMDLDYDRQTGDPIYTLDKTPEEVEAAYTAGKVVLLNDDANAVFAVLIRIEDGEDVSYRCVYNIEPWFMDGNISLYIGLVSLTASSNDLSDWSDIAVGSITPPLVQAKSMDKFDIPEIKEGTVVQYVGEAGNCYEV